MKLKELKEEIECVVSDERSVSLLNQEYFRDVSGPFKTYILTSNSTYGCLEINPQVYDRLEKIL